MYHHIGKSISSLEKNNHANSVESLPKTQIADGLIWHQSNNHANSPVQPANVLFDVENLINGNFPEGNLAPPMSSTEQGEEFDLIALAFRQSGYIDYYNRNPLAEPKQDAVLSEDFDQSHHQPLELSLNPRNSFKNLSNQEDKQDQGISVDDSSHDWDIKNLKAIKVQKFDTYDMWPDGNVRRVYSVSNEKARRHQSGWAMRNTNNHNPQLLKKSCLGVLVCSLGCSQNNSKAIFLRPAICDKARRKQCLRQCLTDGCNGNLVQRPCKGHGGYPVTHFWRFANGAVYFEAKGNHDHPRPTLKCIGNSSSSSENSSWTFDNKNFDYILNEFSNSPQIGNIPQMSPSDHMLNQTPKEIRRKRKAMNNQSKATKDKYLINSEHLMISRPNNSQIIDFNNLINTQNGQMFVFQSTEDPLHANLVQSNQQVSQHPQEHHLSEQTQCQEVDSILHQPLNNFGCSDFEFLNQTYNFQQGDGTNIPQTTTEITNEFFNEIINVDGCDNSNRKLTQQTHGSIEDPMTSGYENCIINYSMNETSKSPYTQQATTTQHQQPISIFSEQTESTSVFSNSSDLNNGWFNLASNGNAPVVNGSTSNQDYYSDYGLVNNCEENQYANGTASSMPNNNGSSSMPDVDSFSISQYTSYSSGCESSDSQNSNLFLFTSEPSTNTPTSEGFYSTTNGFNGVPNASDNSRINSQSSCVDYSTENLCANDCTTHEIEKSLPVFWKNIKVP